MSITVTIKPIKGDQFKVDVEESAKVADLKKKIAEAKPGDFPVEAQKLIFTGKILQDDTTISEIGIKPDSFIVCMATATKPKAAPAPAATPAAAPAPAPTPAPAAAPTPAADAPLPAVLTDLKSLPKWNELATVVARDPNVLNRCMAALDRWPEVRSAIAANPRGFLVMCRQEAGVHDTTPMPQIQTAPAGGNPAALAAALQQNPEMMAQIMQGLPPEMQQMARQNPEAFLQMISQLGAGGMPGMGGMDGGMDDGPAGMPVPAEVSPEDNAHIETIAAMTGRPKAVVTQAYFACDKNQELTVNFLLDAPDEEMPQA